MDEVVNENLSAGARSVSVVQCLATPVRGVHLPALAPLDMPTQDFATRVERRREAEAARLLGAARGDVRRRRRADGAFGYELFQILAFVVMTPLQFLFLILSTIAFGWIALGSLSAALGFLPLFAGERADTIELPPPTRAARARARRCCFPSITRTRRGSPAPSRRWRASCSRSASNRSLRRLRAVRHARRCRWRRARPLSIARLQAKLAWRRPGLLSPPPREHGAQVRQHRGLGRAASARLIESLRHSRRRQRHVGRDAGVAGAGHGARSAKPVSSRRCRGSSAATTLLQHLQQFACNIYGPSVAAGLGFWHRDQGNYWGHNAIIRTAAFAAAAGLPDLPGRKPFGGHILSHDFVEAVLLQRAGWGVHMVPTLEGSYEGMPPNIVDVVARDRRWAQGNLQHLAIVSQPGLTPMGRVASRHGRRRRI